jgi:hypothetical protein
VRAGGIRVISVYGSRRARAGPGNPIGVCIAKLLHRPTWKDPGLRRIADHSRVAGPSGIGNQRLWDPRHVYSAGVAEQVIEVRLGTEDRRASGRWHSSNAEAPEAVGAMRPNLRRGRLGRSAGSVRARRPTDSQSGWALPRWITWAMPRVIQLPRSDRVRAPVGPGLSRARSFAQVQRALDK